MSKQELDRILEAITELERGHSRHAEQRSQKHFKCEMQNSTQVEHMRARRVCRTVRRDKHRPVTTNLATIPETSQKTDNQELCIKAEQYATSHIST